MSSASWCLFVGISALTLATRSAPVASQKPSPTVMYQADCYTLGTSDIAVASKAASESRPLLIKRGFEDDDIEAAVRWVVADLRCGLYKMPRELDPKMVTKKLESVGRLIVISTPDEADVEVDGVRWKEKTEARIFADAGSRIVRVRLSGMAPAQSNCDVRPERIARFRASLSPKMSTAECVSVNAGKE